MTIVNGNPKRPNNDAVVPCGSYKPSFAPSGSVSVGRGRAEQATVLVKTTPVVSVSSYRSGNAPFGAGTWNETLLLHCPAGGKANTRLCQPPGPESQRRVKFPAVKRSLNTCNVRDAVSPAKKRVLYSSAKTRFGAYAPFWAW